VEKTMEKIIGEKKDFSKPVEDHMKSAELSIANIKAKRK